MKNKFLIPALLGATLLVSGCESSTAPDHIPIHAVAQVHAGTGTLLSVFESPDLATPIGLIETIATAETGAEHYNYQGPGLGPSGAPSGVNIGPRTANIWVHENTNTGEFTFGIIFGERPTAPLNDVSFRVEIVGSATNVFLSVRDDNLSNDFLTQTFPMAGAGVFVGDFIYGSNTDGIAISGITGFDWTITVSSPPERLIPSRNPSDFGNITDWFAASGQLADFSDDLVLTLGEEYVITPGERIAVDIDIKPGSDPNSINPKSMGDIPVAIFTTSTADGDAVDFDVQLIDPSTVRFGPGRTSPTHDTGDAIHRQDVDGDGDIDLVLHFNTKLSGISVGDTQACVFGTTVSEDFFGGCDDVRVVEEPDIPEPGAPLLTGPLRSITFFINHADCQNLTGQFDFSLNGVNIGSAGSTVSCRCNSEELAVTFTGRDALHAWSLRGENTLSVQVVGTVGSGVAVGYIRVEVETVGSSGTFALFDATGGDASNRNLCNGLVFSSQQDTFTLTLKRETPSVTPS